MKRNTLMLANAGEHPAAGHTADKSGLVSAAYWTSDAQPGHLF
jgi:hypothetical protein